MNKQLTTEQMLAEVRLSSSQQNGAPLEAAIIKDGLRATHYVAFWDHRYYDEGIDGQCSRTSRKAMLERYPNTIWTME